MPLIQKQSNVPANNNRSVAETRHVPGSPLSGGKTKPARPVLQQPVLLSTTVQGFFKISDANNKSVTHTFDNAQELLDYFKKLDTKRFEENFGKMDAKLLLQAAQELINSNETHEAQLPFIRINRLIKESLEKQSRSLTIDSPEITSLDKSTSTSGSDSKKLSLLLEERNTRFDNLGGKVDNDEEYKKTILLIKNQVSSLGFTWAELTRPKEVFYDKEYNISYLEQPKSLSDLLDTRFTDFLANNFSLGKENSLEQKLLTGNYKIWKSEILESAKPTIEEMQLAKKFLLFLKESNNIIKLVEESNLIRKHIEPEWHLPSIAYGSKTGGFKKESEEVKNISKGWELIKRIVEPDVINKAGPLRSIFPTSGHSYYGSRKEMGLSPATATQTAHEFGHHLEYNLSPEIWMRLVYLLQEKWKGKGRPLEDYNNKTLREPIYHLGENKESPSKPEGFGSLYAATYYTDGGTELISLALEDLAGELSSSGEQGFFKYFSNYDPDFSLLLFRSLNPKLYQKMLPEIQKIEIK